MSNIRIVNSSLMCLVSSIFSNEKMSKLNIDVKGTKDSYGKIRNICRISTPTEDINSDIPEGEISDISVLGDITYNFDNKLIEKYKSISTNFTPAESSDIYNIIALPYNGCLSKFTLEEGELINACSIKVDGLELNPNPKMKIKFNKILYLITKGATNKVTYETISYPKDGGKVIKTFEAAIDDEIINACAVVEVADNEPCVLIPTPKTTDKDPDYNGEKVYPKFNDVIPKPAHTSVYKTRAKSNNNNRK